MKKKLLTIVLTLVMVFSTIPLTSITASAATNGRTGSSTYCTVNVSQSLINKRGKQYAKVKIKTYDATGWYNTRAKVKITLTDGYGRYICSWIGRGGDTLKLGDDHSTYRIYVDYYNDSGNNFITQGNNFSNMGKSYKWNVSSAKDCTIK